jgi:maltooligosyltrehalose trehalohydrolase
MYTTGADEPNPALESAPMRPLRVWAPEARAVVAEIDEARVPMRACDDGWWETEARAGAGYAFLVDGEGPFPDPRSAHQPRGVHGPSRVVDHDAFPWTAKAFRAPPLAQGIVYEIHVGTFTPGGTFDAAIGKLDHLADLGVTHVEIMPVNAFPGARGWGYDGVALYAPHEAYGGPDGLKRLVDACHARGLAVLLDVVYNHLGPEGNYLARFGPYFTDRYRTPWGAAVNLDGPFSDEVRRFVCDNARMWLRDYRLDGLRIDAVHAIHDRSAVHILEQLAQETRALEAELGRPLVLVAESHLNDPRIVASPARGGYGIDAEWNDDLHHALHALFTGERAGYYRDFGRIADVAKAIEKVFVHDGTYSAFRRRRHGRPAGLPGDRFVTFLENHDQVGNRPGGERFHMLVTRGRLRCASALLFAAPQVPLLFQGEEWGASTPFFYFTDHGDRGLGHAVRDGRRREFKGFGWPHAESPDPQSKAAFEQSRLRWDECVAERLGWHRALLRVRRELKGPAKVRFDEAKRWIVVEREGVRLACNLASEPQAVPAEGEVLLASEESLLPGKAFPPESCAFLRG